MNQTEKLRIDPSTIKKILLIRLRRIGDIILTTPAITVLRESFPQAEISYVVEQPFKELIEGNKRIDKVITLQQNLGAIGFFRYLRKIRKEKYDVAIDFHGGPRASLITLFTRARVKIGYKVKYKNFIYDIKLPRGPKEGYIHSVENHINLAKTLGMGIKSSPPLCLPQALEDEKERVNEIFTENNLKGNKIISLHIGAGNEFRRWGLDNLIKLINLLSREPNIKIILMGSQEDKEAEKEILMQSEAPIISVVSQLNLRELGYLISASSLFIGVDSGPMHIAASTSTPIVALFGPNLSAINAPWQANAIVIEKEFDCRPCDQRKCIHRDIRCLTNITPQEVYEACLKYI